MNTSETPSEAAQALVAEAAEWRLIELLFQCPSKTEWKAAVESIAREVHDADLRDSARHAVAEASEGIFHSIFGPGGPAPAREATYQRTIQLGCLMSELQAFYDAFAYAPAGEPSEKEPPDHVSVESGFMSFLRLKQAFAVSSGSEAEVTIVAEGADRFLHEHLSNMAEPLSHALEHSGERYLDLAGRALLRLAGPAPEKMSDILDQGRANADDNIFRCGAECGS